MCDCLWWTHAGHGKLLMKDGTYYEGQFVSGEINGHGFKYFAGSACKYTGQFLNGEMHGHGVMQYHDESIYEGQWVKNKKQGENHTCVCVFLFFFFFLSFFFFFFFINILLLLKCFICSWIFVCAYINYLMSVYWFYIDQLFWYVGCYIKTVYKINIVT